MTDEELTGLARQALNMMKTALEVEKHQGILLATCHEGEGIHRMRKIEDILKEKLGEDWLDHGPAKDIGFGLLRQCLTKFPTPPDAFITVTASNMFKPTAKMLALPVAKQKKLHNQNHGEHHKLAAQGYYRIIDSLTALVQTPKRICVCTQEVDRGALVGNPDSHLMNNDDFGGRMKMFGVDRFKTEFEEEQKKAEVQ